MPISPSPLFCSVSLSFDEARKAADKAAEEAYKATAAALIAPTAFTARKDAEAHEAAEAHKVAEEAHKATATALIAPTAFTAPTAHIAPTALSVPIALAAAAAPVAPAAWAPHSVAPHSESIATTKAYPQELSADAAVFPTPPGAYARLQQLQPQWRLEDKQQLLQLEDKQREDEVQEPEKMKLVVRVLNHRGPSPPLPPDEEEPRTHSRPLPQSGHFQAEGLERGHHQHHYHSNMMSSFDAANDGARGENGYHHGEKRDLAAVAAVVCVWCVVWGATSTTRVSKRVKRQNVVGGVWCLL